MPMTCVPKDAAPNEGVLCCSVMGCYYVVFTGFFREDCMQMCCGCSCKTKFCCFEGSESDGPRARTPVR